jgi:predicted TPR repeat methyltransferase
LIAATPIRSRLIDAASARYRAAGRFAWHFARGKLGGDPAFTGLLERGLIPDGERLLDLGCGQGLLASWLLAARAQFDAADWPSGWPAPPRYSTIAGVELMPRDVDRARAALGDAVDVVAGDIRSEDFGRANAIVILDVLHYIGIAEQDEILRRARDALLPSGTLLFRVGDAGGGWRFRCSTWVDHAVMFARGHGYVRLCCRRLSGWKNALVALGFRVEAIPMSAGTPFANVLLVARL